jgi:hypothetical protein
MAENLTRRRFRRDLEKLMKERPSLQDPERLTRLTHELEAEAEEPSPNGPPPPKRKGRPPKGISQFQQVNVYMPPSMVAELDRRVDKEINRTGRNVSRSDLIREAVVHYLHTQEHMS